MIINSCYTFCFSKEPSKEDKLLQIEESEKRNDEDMVDKV